MKVVHVTVVPLLAIIFLFGCQTNRTPGDKSSLAMLLSLEDRELRSHDSSEREQMSVLFDRTCGRMLFPAYVCQMRTALQNEPYVVCIELPYMDGYPGICRVSMTVMDSSGFAATPWQNREFYMGSRNYVQSFKVLKREDHGIIGLGDVLVAEVQRGGPSALSVKKGKDFYALSTLNGSEPPEMRLLRREGPNENSLRFEFMHYHFRDCERLMDAVVPAYESSTSFWDEVMTKWPLVDKLNALLFLNSIHDYEFDRAYQNGLEEVRRHIVGSEYFEMLERNDSAWVREYAEMLLDPKQDKQGVGEDVGVGKILEPWCLDTP